MPSSRDQAIEILRQRRRARPQHPCLGCDQPTHDRVCLDCGLVAAEHMVDLTYISDESITIFFKGAQ